jgi:CRISPR/Cas system-associated exonuclease Cas4 (RecB family)
MSEAAKSSFLNRIADAIIADASSNDFSAYTVVFPTRRAALLFKLQLAQKFNHAILLPRTYGINDFIEAYTPLHIAEKKELLLALFVIYQKHFPDYNYLAFAPWGEIILNDFDEIDRYLINYKDIFADLRSYKQIESLFQDEEITQQLKSFYELFTHHQPSILKQKFLHIWNILPELYEQLQNNLSFSGKIGSGKALRNMCEMPDQLLKNLDCTKTIMAGFYALSPSEQGIFQYISDHQGKLFWDADSFYCDNPMQEAGFFFRSNPLTSHHFNWKEPYFHAIPKTIQVNGIASLTGQFKHLNQQLSHITQIQHINEDQIAIVLPEEKLLPVLLQHIPEGIQHINVTMGYPFKETGVKQWIDALNNCSKSMIKQEQTVLFSIDQLQNFVTLPISNILFEAEKLNSSSFSNVSLDELPELLRQFLKRWIDEPDPFKKYCAVVNDVYEKFKHLNKTESETAGFLLNEINELYKLITPYRHALDNEAQEMMIAELLETLRIPMSGEPVKGIQIMGMLETRALDFDYLFILNANEGTLPKNKSTHSFIPFTLRKSFGLPLQDDHDAISAYHFWRLFQRANQVALFYHTEVNPFAGGERSRYLLQLFYEMKQTFPNWQIQHQILSSQIYQFDYRNPGVKRTASLTQELIAMAANESLVFSASALQMFINCPLQFYFRYIKKLKEEFIVSEIIDEATFGSIFHEAVQKLYEPIIQQSFTSDLAENLKAHINSVVKSAIINVFDKQYRNNGFTLLVEKIIINYLEKLIDSDSNSEPFKVIELETTYDYYLTLQQNIRVKLTGRFDRIDRTHHGVRIIDYKTGKTDLKSNASISDYFTNPDKKIQLQLFYYALLYQSSNEDTPIQAGVYPLRNISDGIQYPKEGFFNDYLPEYEQELKKLITAIIFESDFTMTDDMNRCKNCSYQNICNR